MNANINELHQGGINESLLTEARRSGSIHQDSTIAEAAQALLDGHARALVVTGEAGAEVGVVTTEDLLRHLAERAESTSTLSTLSYSPIVTEALRELNAAGL